MFCQFQTSYAGKCGMWVFNGDRCERHKFLIEKPKRDKIKKFRGRSKWQAEQGMFNNK